MRTSSQRDRFLVTVFVAGDDYQAYCLYRAGGDYPSGNPPYDQNVQGIGHDQDSWFITQTEDLWKIPVQYALGSVEDGDPGVLRNKLEAYPDIYDLGYRHFGDLTESAPTASIHTSRTLARSTC